MCGINAVQWLLLALVTCAAAIAHPRSRGSGIAQDAPQESSQQASAAVYAPKIVHARDLDKTKEPTCDELKAMWRFSKRQARTPEIINDLTTYRDPFIYNEWAYMTPPPFQATPRYRGTINSQNSMSRGRDRSPPVYGRVIHKVPAGRAPGAGRIRGYDDDEEAYGILHDGSSRKSNLNGVLRFPGGGAKLHTPPPQAGMFNHLKEIIRTERARELKIQRMMEELEAKAISLHDVSGPQSREGHRRGHPHHKITQPVIYQDIEYPVSDEPGASRQHSRGRQYLTNQQRQKTDSIIKYPDILEPGQGAYLIERNRRSGPTFAYDEIPHDDADYYQDADIAFFPIPDSDPNPLDLHNYFYNRVPY